MMPLAAALLVVATTGQFTAPTPRMPSGTAIPPRTSGLGRSNDCGVYLMGCTPATAALVPREAALWERISAKIEVTDTSLHSYIFVGGGPSQVCRPSPPVAHLGKELTQSKIASLRYTLRTKGGGSPVLWCPSMHPVLGLCLVVVMAMCESVCSVLHGILYRGPQNRLGCVTRKKKKK